MTRNNVRALPKAQGRRVSRTAIEKRDGIFLNVNLATRLLNAMGALSVRARAQELGLSVGTIQWLWTTTAPVSNEVVYAFRVRFPEVPYEQLFKERQGVPSHVRIPASTRAAA